MGMSTFVQGDINDEQLKDYFSQYGEITDAVVGPDAAHMQSHAWAAWECVAWRHTSSMHTAKPHCLG